jgi:hypothetical protein
VRPGFVKMRYRAQGVTVGWHPAVHPLSLPVPVSVGASVPHDPIGKAVLQAYSTSSPGILGRGTAGGMLVVVQLFEVVCLSDTCAVHYDDMPPCRAAGAYCSISLAWWVVRCAENLVCVCGVHVLQSCRCSHQHKGSRGGFHPAAAAASRRAVS